MTNKLPFAPANGTFSEQRLAFTRPGSIYPDGKNVLGLVIELDCAGVLGRVDPVAVVAETRTRGTFSVRDSGDEDHPPRDVVLAATVTQFRRTSCPRHAAGCLRQHGDVARRRKERP